MMNKETLIVDEDAVGLRLDVFLAQSLPDLPSRTFIQKMILEGQVLVNGQISSQRYKVSLNDSIEISCNKTIFNEDSIKPEAIPLDVIYEDEAIVLINKPVGISVHPANRHQTGTLAHALKHRFDQLSDVNADRPGIVHRLDRDTSGLIIIAKTNQAHARLGRQFERHTVIKKYLALVHGSVRFDQGVIEVPLKKHSKYHDMRQVAAIGEGKEATTYYEVLNRVQKISFVALYPQTGRTHQLRVHMKHLGHPILGDEKYGTKDSFSRLALHAQCIAFEHPMSRHWIEFCTNSPKEFLPFYPENQTKKKKT